MVQLRKKDKKILYFKRLKKFVSNNDKCFVVGIDNVRSQQMQQIRHSLQGQAEMIMGKNTLMIKCIREYLARDPQVEKLIPLIKENVGLVFTNGNLSDIRDKILSNRVRTTAKAGMIAQCDVSIEPQATNLIPEKTSFFQALSIPTKITKGTIEILNKVNLIKEGTKVGASEATLLNMMNITPFTYGLEILHVYDCGHVYQPAILDIKQEDLIASVMQAAKNIAAVSMMIKHPTVASVPHVMANTFKDVLAVSIMSDYTFKQSEKIKEYLADPSKFASAAPAAEATSGAVKAAKEEKKPEPESESDEDIGMGLFG